MSGPNKNNCPGCGFKHPCICPTGYRYKCRCGGGGCKHCDPDGYEGY